MDNLKLRILTKKSIYQKDIGSKIAMTVDKWIKIRPGYLVWIYFNMEKISFTEDVLNELGIKERINKPGVDHENYEKYKHIYWDNKPIKKTIFYHNKDKLIYSKRKMQARNQGK